MDYFSIAAAAALGFYLMPRAKNVDGMVIENYPSASRPNPVRHIAGHKWTSVGKIKSKMRKKKGTIELDRFLYFGDPKLHLTTMERLMFYTPRWWQRRMESVNTHMQILDLTRGFVFLGEMGSGKTVTYSSLFCQNFYNRALVHDIKGDYTQTFFRAGVDIILNPYDERGYIWDILSEEAPIVETFFSNMMTAIAGGKKDYFSAAAQKNFRNIGIKIVTNETLNPKAKWKAFIDEVEKLFIKVRAGDQRSDKDVISSMDQVLDLFKLMAFRVINGGRTFTIEEFFQDNRGQRLFLLNNPMYSKSLSPLFGAFIAAFSQVHLSKPDTKTDFTLYLLDEYLSFAQLIEEGDRRKIHTAIRSKGGLLFIGLQMIPGSDKKLEEDLTSSSYAFLVFSIKEENTKKFVQGLIGKWKYKMKNVTKNKGGVSIAEQEKEEDIVSQSEIDRLAGDYAHITFIPSEGILYRATSKFIEFPKRAESFEKYDLREFVKWDIERNERMEKEEEMAGNIKGLIDKFTEEERA